MGSAASASVRCASHMGCLTYRIPELATIPTIVLPSDSGRHATSAQTFTTAPLVGPTSNPSSAARRFAHSIDSDVRAEQNSDICPLGPACHGCPGASSSSRGSFMFEPIPVTPWIDGSPPLSTFLFQGNIKLQRKF